MTVRRFEPGLSETQAWERSAERNPPSQGRARAIARHAEIIAGDGSAKDAARETPVSYPHREIYGTV
jgi:hypothetical protein